MFHHIPQLQPQLLILEMWEFDMSLMNVSDNTVAIYSSPIFEKSQQHGDKTPEIVLDSYSSSMKKARSPAQSFGSAVVADDVARDKQSYGVNATVSVNLYLV
ncbi:hypothetical protein VNO77_09748 [Canavalia gladiata]|uniref:Uncharacterized protein n=1 Tax=Canavalia gladiata TaxID=3824 RepID=A0AAN9QWQ9_CANGL